MYHLTVFILYRGLFYYYIYFNWGTLAIFQDEIKYIYTQELYCQTQVWHWRLKLGGKRYAIVFLTWTVHTFVGWLFSRLQSWSRIYIHTVLRSPFNTTRTCALSRWRGKAGEGNVGPALPQSMTSIILYCQDSLAWYVWSLTVSATFY